MLFRSVPRLAAMYATGGTPDIAATNDACRRLVAEPAARHVLITLADGEGGDSEALARVLRAYERRGVLAIGIGIGLNMNPAYTHRVRVDKVADIATCGLSALLDVIARDMAQREAQTV